MNGITAACFGRLGRDPEMRFLPSGKPMCQVSIAVDDFNKDESAQTEWLRVTVWGDLAESRTVEHLKKGMEVYVEGRIKLSTWDEREDGSLRARLEMNAWVLQPIAAFRKEAKAARELDDVTESYAKLARKQGKRR